MGVDGKAGWVGFEEVGPEIGDEAVGEEGAGWVGDCAVWELVETEALVPMVEGRLVLKLLTSFLK